MLAIGSASIVEMLSLRRVHSPAASSASANSAAQDGAHAGAEQAGLDRIAHHEEAAERQRQAADPHHPAGADRLLEAAIGLRQGGGGAAAGPAAASLAVSAGVAAGAMDSTSEMIGGGFRHDSGRGGRTALVRRAVSVAAVAAPASRSAAARFHRVEPRAQLRHLVHRLHAR